MPLWSQKAWHGHIVIRGGLRFLSMVLLSKMHVTQVKGYGLTHTR
ncbi:Uncharacterised protein [Klebsiella pneumoniae]|nr:Uncharacterised protein [Klebsiella pneumoniae]